MDTTTEYVSANRLSKAEYSWVFQTLSKEIFHCVWYLVGKLNKRFL